MEANALKRSPLAAVQFDTSHGAQESRELNIGYFSRMVRGTPWVRVKTAASLDGTTALHNGASQWITSRAARVDGHAWRARACAVLTGIGTVLDDNPRLNVREVPTPKQPAVVVVDSRLQTPLNAHVLMTGRQCFIYAAVQDSAKQAALEDRGAQVIYLPNAAGKVDLAAMLKDLGRRGINELHVEAGHKLNGSMVREGLVDELLVYLAPRLLGSGLGMTNWGPLTALADGLQLQFESVEMVGSDLRVIARVEGRDNF
ncbi:riboflavin biosynthesis protein RibD [Acidovorax sp. Leaf78]|nr:riboflavin biosynthesis protein RibD [Acidovorax sp. Leaf78]